MKYCSEHDLHHWHYDVVAGVDCLVGVQERSEENAVTAGKPAQHSSFKEARAAMCAFWALVHGHHDDNNFASEPRVRAIAVGLRRTNPLLRKYDDTWDISLVFNKIFTMAARGHLIVNMPHQLLRPWLIVLLKLKTGCHSGDVAPGKAPSDGSTRRGGICRGFYPRHRNDPALRQGLRGEFNVTVKHLRFFMNKTVGGQVSEYSVWHDLGNYLVDTPEYPYLSAACPRAALEAYIKATAPLPRADDYLLISNRREGASKEHFGISAQTAANDTVAVMRACGVPTRFTAHSTRHATLSKKAQEGHNEDQFLKDACLSQRVFRQFYYQPIVGIDDALVERAAELAAGGHPQTKAAVVASLEAAPAVQDTSDGSEPDDAETYVVAAVLDRRDVGDGA